MKAKSYKALLLLILLASLCSMDASAEEYKVLLGKKAFGVSLTSPMNDYIKILGKPDGTISMGKDRVGMMFGQKLLVIFWGNKLWEIVAWNKPPIHAFGYIRNGQDQDKFNIIIDGSIKPGMLRKKASGAISVIKSKDKDQEVEGDEYGVAFSNNNTTVNLGFEYQNWKRGSVADDQVLSELQITFEANNPTLNRNK
jgi:hypothetical protein